MRTVWLRPSCNPKVGLGHFSRMLALYEYLKADFKIKFLLEEHPAALQKIPSPAEFQIFTPSQAEPAALTGDAIIIDDYSVTAATFEHYRKLGLKTVYIDDFNSGHLPDVSVHLSSAFQEKDFSNKAYCGLQYLLLHPLFFKKNGNPPSNTILISMGGVDTHDYTFAFLRKAAAQTSFRFQFILGPMYAQRDAVKNFVQENNLAHIQVAHSRTSEQMAELYWQNANAIIPASTMALEACALGLNAFLVMTEKHQLHHYQSLIKANCAVGLGAMDTLDAGHALEQAIKTSQDHERMQQILQARLSVFDGNSPERWKKLIRSVCGD